MLIRDTARRLAHHAWLERRLFEVVGSWAEGEVAGVLGAISHHHAWRAAQLEPLVPVLHDLDPAELHPAPAWVDYLDALAATSDPAGRLAVLADVALPAQLAAYERDLEGLTEVADAPVLRVLAIVRDDLRRDWWAATSLRSDLLRTKEDRERVATHQVAVERRLLLATNG